MKRKRKVLSLWATLILVFAALLAVAGITVLIVFLTRGNNNDVLPENVEVSFDESGLGYHELITENESQHLKLYVSSDFKLSFSSTTEDITKKKVTLSIGDRPATNGYIENDIIRVPKYSELGQTINVQLMKSYNTQAQSEVVNGGKCTIKVETENTLKTPFYVDVFVDVPVTSISTGILNGDTIKNDDQVAVVGEEFSLATNFTPSASKNIYKQANVAKEVFYEMPTASNAPIELDWTTNKFIAKSTTSSTPYKITAKTFLNAYYRKQAFDFARSQGINLPANIDNTTVKITKELNDVILAYFRREENQGNLVYVQDELNIAVVDLQIEQNDFQIKSNTEMAIKFDQESILHTKNGNLNLDLSIRYGQNHDEQYNMFSNVGIKIPNEKWLTIKGGDIVEVAIFKDETGKITSKKIKILTYDEYSSADYTPEDGGENVTYSYYVLPDKSQPDPRDYFWRLSAEELNEMQSNRVELEVNLFYYNSEGKLDALLNVEKDDDPEQSNANERVMFLTVGSSISEDPPSWSTERISLTIRYNNDGTVNLKQAKQDLSLLLDEISYNNIYRQVVYFMVADDGRQITNIQEHFNVGEGKEYTKNYLGDNLSISQLHGNGHYYLYQVSGTMLEALTSYKDHIYVLAATIKTKADGENPYYEEDGKYKIVGISTPKLVTVTTMLSLSNMNASFSIEGDYYNEPTGSYKIPSIIRTAEGMQKDVIKFTLDVTNVEAETIQKIKDEKNNGALRVEGPYIEINGQRVQYFTLSSLVEEEDNDNDDTTARLTGYLQVNAEAFNALHKQGGEEEVKLDFKMIYEDGDLEKTEADKQKVVEFKNNDNRADGEVFVYYPKITGKTSIISDYLNDEKLSTPISVKKKSNTTSISWGEQSFDGGINELNEMFVYSLKDQYDRAIELELANAYRVELLECKNDGSPADKIYISLKNSSQQILDFPFTNGEVTTYLCARVYDIVSGQYATDAQGREIQTDKLTFQIESEGVSRVDYSSNQEEFETAGDGVYKEYTENEGDVSNVTIRKIISGNDKTGARYLNLNNLIHVWTGSRANIDTNNWANKNAPLRFTYSATNNYSLSDITSVILFKSSQNTDLTQDVISSSDLVKENVQQIVLLYAINQTITLNFIVTDEAGTFQIFFNLVLIPDRSMTPNFENYVAKYSSYLVNENSGISSGVFGGDKIKLNDLTGISVGVNDQKYSWIAERDEQPVFDTDDEQRLKIIKGDNGELYLQVGEVLSLTSAKIVVYYGIKSEYAMQMTIRVLINPNFVIVENKPLVELNKLEATTFASTFTIYRAVDNGNGYAELADSEKTKATKITDPKFYENGKNTLFSEKTLIFNSTSATAYIKFTNGNKGDSFENYKYLLAQEKTGIKLSLNQVVNQSFEISYEENTANYNFHAIKIKDNKIFKPLQDSTFSFDVGMTYSAKTEDLIQDNNGNTLKTAVYGGQEKAILLYGTQYKGVGDVKLESVYGGLVKIANYVQSSDGVGILSLEGNGIKLNVNVVDSQESELTVDIDIPVIISRIGDIFIKYKDAENGEVNRFGDKDLQYLLGDDLSEVCDVYDAGKIYEIVNSTDNGGFVFDNNGWTTDLKLVTEVDGILRESTGNTYATILDNTRILIYNLEQSFEDSVYLLVKFTISDSIRGSYSWLYRIKVNPSFIKGSVNYPFSEEGEYFDETSLYYQNEEYVVDVTEEFDEINSNLEIGQPKKTRFNEPTTIDAQEIANIVENYKIQSDGQNFEYYFSSEKAKSEDKTVKTGDKTNKYLHVKLNNKDDQITIKLIKYYRLDINGNLTDLVGSDIEYTMLFNQGEKYSEPEIKRSEDDGDVAIKDKQANTYYDKIVYNPDKVVWQFDYSVKIYEVNGDIQNPLADGDLTVKMHEIDKNGTIISPMSVFEEPELIYSNENESFQFTLEFISAFTNNFKEDKYVELSFYTTQKRAFVLVIHITHIYKEEAEKLFVKEIESGRKYSFNNWEDNKNKIGEENITFDGKENRAIFVSAIDEVYFKTNNITLEIVNEVEQQYEYLYIEKETLRNQKFEYIDFALLEEDKVFVLKVQFYKDNLLKFSYNFNLLVKENSSIKKDVVGEIDLNEFLKKQEGDKEEVYKIYGGVRYSANTNAALESLNMGLEMLPKYVESGYPTALPVTYSVWTLEKTGGDADGFGNSTNIFVNPKYVDADTRSSLVLTFELKFTGGTSDDAATQRTHSYKKSIVINFTISRSVELETNYAYPDGINESEREYIAATAREPDKVYQTEIYSNFFEKAVTFAKKGEDGKSLPRISIKDLYEGDNIARDWTIESTKISNASIIYDGKTIEEIGVFEKNANNLKTIAFTLVDKTKNGIVEFKVTINGVTISYNITIVPESVIKVTRNFKNTINIDGVQTDTEIVFAENLAKSEQQQIFADDRLLKVTFNKEYLNRDLFLMFENKSGMQKWVPVTVTSTEEMLIDAGVSLAGYDYKNAFTRTPNYDEKENYVNDKRGDVPLDNVLAKDIVKTQRIELNYADGKAIKHDDLKVYLNGTTSDDDKNKVILTKDDFREVKSYKINVSVGDGKYITADSSYKIFLTADFQVINNADNANSYTVIEIQANPNDGTKTLLNSYNIYNDVSGVRGFGISKLDGTNYDQATMKRENKRFRLKIYGIDESLPLKNQDSLSEAALAIHKNLKNQYVKDTKIKYQTGIRPYGGMEDLNEDGIFPQGNYDNLIALSGVNQSATSDSDYYIIARGASNDGNHVMMRVSYTVTFGEQTVEAESNILFRVVPNSEVRARQSNRGGDNIMSTEVVNGRTVQSNKTLPYQIELTEHAVKFYGTIKSGSSEDPNYSNINNAIVANMYGQNSNDTILKSFTYKMMITEEANSWNSFLETFTSEDANIAKNKKLWQTEESNYKNDKNLSADGLGLYVPDLTLGEKVLYIELENEFGYKIRFYFSRTSSQNPTVVTESSNLTLKEGDDFIVGAQFTEIQPTKFNNEIRYQPFIYSRVIDREDYNDQITIYNYDNIPKGVITQITLQATLATSQLDGLTIDEPKEKPDNYQAKTSLNAGEILVKTITSVSQTFKICGNVDNVAGWSVSVSGENLKITSGLKQSTFDGASIVLIITTSNNVDPNRETQPVVDYYILYGATPVYTNYATVENHSAREALPSNTGSEVNTLKVITLGGLDAYGVNNRDAIVDINSLTRDFKSKFNSITTKSVDFYYDNIWIGGSKPTYGAIKETKNDNVENSYASVLYTSNKYSFYTQSSIETGTSYGAASSSGAKVSDKHFTVPYINGILYQYPTSELPVEMRITIVNTDGFEAEIRQNVIIQREASFDGLFTNFNEKTNNYKVTDNAAVIKKEKTLYNDTLEIDMPAHSSVSFAVNNKEFTTDDENGNLFVAVPSRIDGGEAETVPAKVITLTNERNYAITEYVSITNSMQDGVLEKNLTSGGDSFYVYIISDSTQDEIEQKKIEFRYNGENITINNKKFNERISEYSSITLHIENENEMAAYGYKYKMETLHFLLDSGKTAKYQYQNADGNYVENSNEGNSVYQISQNFEVYPNYTQGKQIDQNRLAGYYKVASSDKKYYIIPISVWGEKLQLTSGMNEETTTLAEVVTSGVKTHQFLFEISVGGGNGAGSAFIDDAGLITTNTNLDFSHIVTVNVYQKLSGLNGFFEEKTKRIPLGSVSFMLDGDKAPTTISQITEGVWKQNNEVLSIPTGYTLYYKNSRPGYTKQTSFPQNNQAFAYSLGQTMYFHDMFGNSYKELRNVTYHLVGYNLNNSGETYVYYNNLDSYTLSQPGTYTLRFIATGLSSDKIPSSELFSATVTIFNDAARTTKVVEKTKASSGDTTYNLAELDKSATDWYELFANGTSTLLSSGNVKLSTGISERSFLAVTGGTSKIYDVTFFVTETETKSVNAYVAPGGSFELKNLYPNDEEEYQFYAINTENLNKVDKIDVELFKDFTTQQTTNRDYILVATSEGEDGNVISTAIKYNITYYITSKDSTESVDIVVSAEDYKSSDDKEENDCTGIKTDDIKSKVAAWLGVGEGNISKIFLKNADGTLTELKDSYFDLEFGSARGIGDFLIVYTSNGKPAYRNVKINFYTYTEKFADNQKLKFFIDESTYIYASSLYSEIRNKVEAAQGSLVALYEYTENEGKFVINLSTVQRIVFGNNFVDGTFEKTYYVLAGGKYYLMDICITKLPISRDEIKLDLAKNDLDFDALKMQILEGLSNLIANDDVTTNYEKLKELNKTIDISNLKLYKNLGEIYSEITTTEIPNQDNVTYYVIYNYEDENDELLYYVCEVYIAFSKVVVHLESGHGEISSIATQQEAVKTYLKGYLDDENVEVKFWANQKLEVEIVQMAKPVNNNAFANNVKSLLKLEQDPTIFFYTDDSFAESLDSVDFTQNIEEVYIYVVQTNQKLKVVFNEEGYLCGLHFFTTVGYDQYVFAYYQKEINSVKNAEYVKIDISGTTGIVSYKTNFENKFKNLFNLRSDAVFNYYTDANFNTQAVLSVEMFSDTMFVIVEGQKYIVNDKDFTISSSQLKHKDGVEIEIKTDLVVENLDYSKELSYENLKELLDEKLLTEEANTEKSYLIFSNANFDKILDENSSIKNIIYVRLKQTKQTSSFTFYKFTLENV